MIRSDSLPAVLPGVHRPVTAPRPQLPRVAHGVGVEPRVRRPQPRPGLGLELVQVRGPRETGEAAETAEAAEAGPGGLLSEMDPPRPGVWRGGDILNDSTLLRITSTQCGH